MTRSARDALGPSRLPCCGTVWPLKPNHSLTRGITPPMTTVASGFARRHNTTRRRRRFAEMSVPRIESRTVRRGLRRVPHLGGLGEREVSGLSQQRGSGFEAYSEPWIVRGTMAVVARRMPVWCHRSTRARASEAQWSRSGTRRRLSFSELGAAKACMRPSRNSRAAGEEESGGLF